MIDKQRIESLMRYLDMKQAPFAESIGLTQSKLSKVINGLQSLPEEAIAMIFEKYKVHPNWLFGYEGEASTPTFLTDLVPKKMYEQSENEKVKMAEELKEVYKQLAEERGKIIQQQNQTLQSQSQSIESLKNIEVVPTKP